jgi:hypothetical protein
MNNHRYTEIEQFFTEFIKSDRNEHENMFVQSVFKNLSCKQLNNYMMNDIQDVKYIQPYGFASFCSHDYIWLIFKELKKLLINQLYLIDINDVNNIINIEYDSNIIYKTVIINVVDNCYIYSINKIIYQLILKFHNNYEYYIKETNELNKLTDNYDRYIYKYSSLNWLLRINIPDRYSEKYPVNTNLYCFGLTSNCSNDQLTYDIYSDIYNFFLCYLNNLNDIEKLKSTKKIKIIKLKKTIEPITDTETLTDSLDNVKLTDTKKIKKKSIPLALKRNVWNKHIGEEIGKTKCLCCKLTDISQTNFSCGHIISEFNGGELTLNNLKPICISCNSSMGTANMEEFINKYGL